MSKSFIHDIEQALGPVLAQHFYSPQHPKNLSLYTQHAAKLATIRFIRSQTDSIIEAAEMLGTSRQAVMDGVRVMGYADFKSIPKDEWGVNKLFYKKT
jgi:hypothetical protein